MRVANFIVDRLERRRQTTWRDLFAEAEKAWGSSMADGKYTVKDVYDAMEAGVNLHLRNERMPIEGDAREASEVVKGLTKLIDILPTQTKRTAEQDEFQQFSTPPALAYVASWVANVTNNDVMMEPSAGTGDLAIWAEQQGAELILNELSKRRAKILSELFPDARVLTENAEQINNILPADVVPTVVVMNPPFSATAGRVRGQRDTMNGARHIEQALKRLADGGRLVAIVGSGMAHDRQTFKEWWSSISANYNVRANIGIDGKEYAKYGTTFDNQILVIDKTGPTTGDIVTERVGSVSELPKLLEGIRSDRLPPTQRNADQPRSGSAPQENKLDNGPEKPTGGSSAPPVAAGREQTNLPGGVGQGSVGGSRPGRGGTGPVAGQAGESKSHADNAPADNNGQRGPVPDRPVGDTGGGSGDTSGRIDIGDAGRAADNNEHGELTDSVFEQYTPQRLRIVGAHPHPGKLVQSAAMASVDPPEPTYSPNLPKNLIDDGKLSIAQLESIVYAGQAHQQFLPNGERRGFFIGDGTGVGKGREISGIILDNMRQGRKKALWVSFNEGLINDARRDFSGVGGDENAIFWHGKTKPAGKILSKEGILFTSYTTLKSKEKRQPGDKGQAPPRSRIDQIVEWLGEDFDGAIVFDESHSMGNCVEMPGKRGKKKAAEQALAGVALQARLPKARVVYVSATGATEVSNLGYASRLGLWGEGTPFPNVAEFVASIASGGVAAMELISRDMKALGMYIARSLSFDGVTYQKLEHELTPLQVDMYNELAKAWQVVLSHVNEALAMTGGNKNKNAKSAAMSAFWGSHQRFFNQVITSLQTPTVIDDMRRQIEAGNAVVVQLVNTNEATQEREVAKAEAAGTDLEELDFTPRQMLMDYVRNSFPVQAYQETLDQNGNMVMVPVLDAAGNPVFDRGAVAMRDELLGNLEQIKVPGNPIDEIINAFGTESVGEVTGRSRRFVTKRGDDGAYSVVEEKRGKNAARVDATAFQNDKKRVLIFSQAGGTGYSFHADNTAKNQRKRIHYILQTGWRADVTVQGFGRSHRTNQASEPAYILPSTNLKAQKRFISSIARRLDQLGALTKGHRQASSNGLFSASDNLESRYAESALEVLFQDMYGGKTSLSFKEITDAMGLTGLVDEKTGGLNVTKIPEIPQFLNRLLSLQTHQQDAVFAEFERRLDDAVSFAIQNGTYDTGLQTIRAQSIKKVSDEVVYQDKRTGAETRYVEVDITNPIDYLTPERAKAWAKAQGARFVGWMKDAKGDWFGFADLGARADSRGRMSHRGVAIRKDGSTRYLDKADEIIRGWKWGVASKVTIATRIPDEKEAMNLLSEQVSSAPKTKTVRDRMIVGAILPIWDRVEGHAQIVRLQTDSGERMIGRLVGKDAAERTLKNLGVGLSFSKMSSKEMLASIKDGSTAVLANGWSVYSSSVSGQKRVEISPKSGQFTRGETDILRSQGAFVERIGWQERVFIPQSEEGVGIFSRIVESKPVVDLIGQKNSGVEQERSPVVFSHYGTGSVTPADSAIYTMAQEGKSAADI
ncbi:MAG TPA: strawberry notch family protein, partial [Nitrospira sp.]|nr:strawberry notch family protein [Nitrospira sp.]